MSSPDPSVSFSPAISLRPITDDDMEFLFQLYASTRSAEKELAGWEDEPWEGFMRMQFDLQHTQYMHGYQHPSFDIVLLDSIPIGRFYVNRLSEEIRIIEIGLLAEYRGRGIGAGLLKNILQEGDDQSIPVTLHVERNNPALALYQRLGFQVEEATEVYYFMKRSPAQAEGRTRTKRSWRTIISPGGVSRQERRPRRKAATSRAKMAPNWPPMRCSKQEQPWDRPLMTTCSFICRCCSVSRSWAYTPWS